MGRKLDLSSLTEEEAEHVLEVVQRDMRLRKTEEERLSDLKQELDEEDTRCVLLSRQRGFNQRCCIRCCSSFSFLLKPRRRCLDCQYNVCKRCCSYSSTEKGWICCSCEKSRLLKTQSLEWFYSNVRRRFKRFGSAKVLKTLYRRHIAEQGNLAELTEGSTYDESLDNDDSMYESDSTFYKHTEEHSMAETISVALRVAEEAIDEAIAKAESYIDNQEKLNEARYLRDNRGELIQELTTTIVEKIICRKKEEMHPECNVEWPPDQKRVLSSYAPPTERPRSALAFLPSPKTSLWRSRSAFSLFTDEKRHQHGKAQEKPVLCKDCTQGLKKDGLSVPTLPSWKSVDRLDNSMLQSQDGNWIALQSTQLSRPSLLTKRKSQVFSALEKESGVVSAYDGMDSDTEPDPDGNLGAALMGIPNKMFSSNLPNDHQSTSPQPSLKTPTQAAADQVQTLDQDISMPKFHKSPFPFLKRKVPLSSQRLSVMDINFNPEGAESSENDLEDSRVKRTRRRRRSKQEDEEEKEFPTLSSAEPDYSRILLDVVVKRRSKREGVSGFLSDQTMDTTASDIQSSEAGSPDAFPAELEKHYALIEDQLTSTLRELASQVRETQFSSTEDELDRVEDTVAEENDNAENNGEDKRVEALWNIEVETEKEESEEMEEHEGETASEKLQEVETNGDEMVKMIEKTQNYPETLEEDNIFGLIVKEDERDFTSVEDMIELENSRNFRTETIHNIHDEIQEMMEKQSEIEKTAEIPQNGCPDNKNVTERDLTVLNESEVVITDNTDSEGQVEQSEDLLWYTNQRINEEKVEEVGEDTDTIHRDIKPELFKEQTKLEEEAQRDNQCHLEIENQSEISGQKRKETKKGQQVKSQEVREQADETDNMSESREHSMDNTASESAVETVENSCANQDSTTTTSEEDEEEYERMIDSAVKTLDNMEEEIEAHDIEVRFTRSYETDQSEEEEEIVAEKKEESEKTQDEEIDEDSEVEKDKDRTRINEPPEEKFMERELDHDLVVKTEEHTLVLKEETCNDHVIKEDLNTHIYSQEVFLTPEEIYKKYTAASLRSITTEVLKVLNATEDLIQGAMCDELGQSESRELPALPPAQSKKLDEQLSRLEENVYVAASAVFGLEAELGDLEECARSISGATSEGELAHLEEQVASVAAQVQQSELQVSDIAARIAALKNAGLNVAPQTRFAKPQTIDTSRQHRRRLPAPPMQDKKA